MACENFEAQIPEVNTRMAHGEETADPCTAAAMLTSCPSCSRKTADTALLVTLLKVTFNSIVVLLLCVITTVI